MSDLLQRRKKKTPDFWRKGRPWSKKEGYGVKRSITEDFSEFKTNIQQGVCDSCSGQVHKYKDINIFLWDFSFGISEGLFQPKWDRCWEGVARVANRDARLKPGDVYKRGLFKSISHHCSFHRFSLSGAEIGVCGLIFPSSSHSGSCWHRALHSTD